ncbi:MAG TPA: alcohol dehydrogenase catalytic domain-containing protein, partial [Streptosporangiaceae bacterium]
MKAAVSRSFGPPDVVTVADVPRPEPRDDEILVRVRAAAVGVVDSLARRGSPWYARAHFGVLRPRFPVLGCDFAGQVEAAGSAVSRFGVGEAVFGTIAPRFGAHAEYLCLPEHGAVAPKPANVSFAEAAALADATALCFLRDKAGLRSGRPSWSTGVRGGRLGRGTAGRALRRHGNRRLQRPASPAGPQAGRRIRHRLHQDGFHPRRTPLRRDLRRGRHELVRPLPPGFESGW